MKKSEIKKISKIISNSYENYMVTKVFIKNDSVINFCNFWLLIFVMCLSIGFFNVNFVLLSILPFMGWVYAQDSRARNEENERVVIRKAKRVIEENISDFVNKYFDVDYVTEEEIINKIFEAIIFIDFKENQNLSLKEWKPVFERELLIRLDNN